MAPVVFHRWSLGMGKSFHPTLYNGCNYLSMQGLKLTPAPLKRQQEELPQTEPRLVVRPDEALNSFHWKIMKLKILPKMFSFDDVVMVNPNHNPQSLWGKWCWIISTRGDALWVGCHQMRFPYLIRQLIGPRPQGDIIKWQILISHEMRIYMCIYLLRYLLSFMLRIWCREELEILHFHGGWSYFVCIFQRFCLLMKPSDTTGVDRHMAFITKAYICPKLHFYPWYYINMDTCLVTWFRE